MKTELEQNNNCAQMLRSLYCQNKSPTYQTYRPKKKKKWPAQIKQIKCWISADIMVLYQSTNTNVNQNI